ncbi:MAG: cAMP regulatory protein [Acidobacteriota bacterium]|jgi:CRP-like cAMP-binding protein
MAPKRPVPKRPVARALPEFDVHTFLASANVPQRVVRYASGASVFAQGSVANNVFYIQDGGVKLSVLSTTGK